MSFVPQRISVHLDRAATRAVRQGALRIYHERITRQRGDGAAGDVAVLYDPKDRPFALGIYDPHSPIRVRVLAPELGHTIDADFVRQRIAKAIDKRKRHFEDASTNGYRLLHGPGNGLPGLVIDRYANTLVLKCYTHAWLPWLPVITSALQRDETFQVGMLRLSRKLQEDADLRGHFSEGMLLWGQEAHIAAAFQEHGIHFEVDPRHGQKTGFFLDQRENRLRVQQLSQHKDILNVFCYTGGFSLYAAQGGATSVTSIDASRQAMDALERNIALNPSLQKTRFTQICDDAFDAMRALRESAQSFDIVIVDPPSFAKKNSELEGARRAYQRLAFEASTLTKHGGTLVFASCSRRVDTPFLEEALHQGAKQARAQVDVFERTGHPVDHPAQDAADQYLKCLYAKVWRG